MVFPSVLYLSRPALLIFIRFLLGLNLSISSIDKFQRKGGCGRMIAHFAAAYLLLEIEMEYI